MKAEVIIEQLKSMAVPKFKENVVRMGIPEESCIGVSTLELRKIASQIGKSQELAWELWNSGYHEAKLLAVLLMEKKKVDLDDIETMMKAVFSWDLSNHICKNLIVKLPGYQDLIYKWKDEPRIFYRRAAFTLIADMAVHDKHLNDEQIKEFFNLIIECADDDSEQVQKAISWALRELGKINEDYVERAIEIAYELKESESRNSRWIGKDALKELETLVQAPGRSRLITSHSAMGRYQ